MEARLRRVRRGVLRRCRHSAKLAIIPSLASICTGRATEPADSHTARMRAWHPGVKPEDRFRIVDLGALRFGERLWFRLERSNLECTVAPAAARFVRARQSRGTR